MKDGRKIRSPSSAFHSFFPILLFLLFPVFLHHFSIFFFSPTLLLSYFFSRKNGKNTNERKVREEDKYYIWGKTYFCFFL